MEPRTFTKNGQTRTATKPAEVVRLRFDGWKEKHAAVKKAAAPRKPRAKTAKKTAPPKPPTN